MRRSSRRPARGREPRPASGDIRGWPAWLSVNPTTSTVSARTAMRSLTRWPSASAGSEISADVRAVTDTGESSQPDAPETRRGRRKGRRKAGRPRFLDPGGAVKSGRSPRRPRRQRNELVWTQLKPGDSHAGNRSRSSGARAAKPRSLKEAKRDDPHSKKTPDLQGFLGTSRICSWNYRGVSDGTRTRGRRDHNPAKSVALGCSLALQRGLSRRQLRPLALTLESELDSVRLCRLVADANERDIELIYVNDNYGDFAATRDDLVRAAQEGRQAGPDQADPAAGGGRVPAEGATQRLLQHRARPPAPAALDRHDRAHGQVTEQCILTGTGRVHRPEHQWCATQSPT